MNQLLDTNVVSALTSARVDPALVRWSERQVHRLQAVSVITLAELRFGVELLSAGSRKAQFEDALSSLIPRLFEGRILDLDGASADAFGRLLALAERRGLGVGDRDLMLAATALAHDLVLMTRNVKHFAPLGVPVFNPWKT